MKLPILYALLFLGFPFFSKGQNKAIDPENLTSVFYKITDPNTQKTSYLFGTMHMVTKDKFVLPKSVKSKLRETEALVLEIADFNPRDLLGMMFLKEGKLSDFLSDVQRDSLYDYTSEMFGLDSAAFEKRMGKMHPLLFSQLAYKDILSKSESYDQNFQSLANKYKINAIGLESATEQLDFFNELSDEGQADLIMYGVRNAKTLETEFLKMQETYLNQNLGALTEKMEEGNAMTDFMEETLLRDRNRKWIVTLAPLLKSKSTFIAVGAAHLCGQDGLIQLLQNHGFIIEVITIDLTQKI